MIRKMTIAGLAVMLGMPAIAVDSALARARRHVAHAQGWNDARGYYHAAKRQGWSPYRAASRFESGEGGGA